MHVVLVNHIYRLVITSKSPARRQSRQPLPPPGQSSPPMAWCRHRRGSHRARHSTHLPSQIHGSLGQSQRNRPSICDMEGTQSFDGKSHRPPSRPSRSPRSQCRPPAPRLSLAPRCLAAASQAAPIPRQLPVNCMTAVLQRPTVIADPVNWECQLAVSVVLRRSSGRLNEHSRRLPRRRAATQSVRACTYVPRRRRTVGRPPALRSDPRP